MKMGTITWKCGHITNRRYGYCHKTSTYPCSACQNAEQDRKEKEVKGQKA